RAKGVEERQAFLSKVGQLDRLRTELPESAEPLVPRPWGELNTVTISYGHGLSVAPLQSVMGVAAMVNGGYLIPPTFLRRTPAKAREIAKRVVQPETNAEMRYLRRLNAEKGAPPRGAGEGVCRRGEKGGPAERTNSARYPNHLLRRFCGGVLPADEPRFLLLIMLDEPKPTAETHGFATSGWNAAPVAAKVITRIAPLLGLEPRFDLPAADQLILAAAKDAR